MLVETFGCDVSPSGFILSSFFTASILVVSGKTGRVTKVQLDWLSSRIPTTSSDGGELCGFPRGSFLNDLGFGSGDNSSGLHFISPNLLFPR